MGMSPSMHGGVYSGRHYCGVMNGFGAQLYFLFSGKGSYMYVMAVKIITQDETSTSENRLLTSKSLIILEVSNHFLMV